ncbi:MAG: prepilin peptidase [Firmicutes bacterium]|nr:prepilin peptidase [Bacillota bacterium]
MKYIEFIADFLTKQKSCITSLLLILLTIAAVYNDIKSYKIPNKLNFTFAFIGLAYNCVTGSFQGAIYGMLFPMLLYPLFMARMMGAGDIKLFCAIGSIVGIPDIIKILCYSILANGLIALLLLAVRKQGMKFRNIFNWFKTCFAIGKIVEYQSLESKNKGIFRYAIGIMFGVIYYIITDIILGGKYALL